MQEVHVACPCCKNKRLFDADPAAVEGEKAEEVRTLPLKLKPGVKPALRAMEEEA